MINRWLWVSFVQKQVSVSAEGPLASTAKPQEPRCAAGQLLGCCHITTGPALLQLCCWHSSCQQASYCCRSSSGEWRTGQCCDMFEETSQHGQHDHLVLPCAGCTVKPGSASPCSQVASRCIMETVRAVPYAFTLLGVSWASPVRLHKWPTAETAWTSGEDFEVAAGCCTGHCNIGKCNWLLQLHIHDSCNNSGYKALLEVIWSHPLHYEGPLKVSWSNPLHSVANLSTKSTFRARSGLWFVELWRSPRLMLHNLWTVCSMSDHPNCELWKNISQYLRVFSPATACSVASCTFVVHLQFSI